ncbi:sulfite exporter TauE/SafE family protein [Cellulophaga baltica]|uniref:sulfite exporter TauE/SafE family protein n=1 Tax=Cellulophaga baltica TaxID=76594 RepID=UPI0024942C7D|nr:sulfite exporter TauE/SafE family protein [Cellulophaga baltica]
MDITHFFGYLGALLVGLILGLMGGGGSIFTIPILTYLFHISPTITTAYSLFVVGISASVGVLRNLKRGLIAYKTAVVFAIPAIVAVYFARKYVLAIIPVEVVTFHEIVVTKDMALMLFFAVVMLLSSVLMLQRNTLILHDKKPRENNYIKIVAAGFFIGLVTGIIGIGGGFLIIPILVFFLKIPMKKAVATSLFIIAIKSLIGFLGDVSNLSINWTFLIPFTTLSILGIFLGIYLSSFVKGEKLKRYFGWMVLVMSVGVLWKEFFYK